jgi:hypothetical protein
MVGLRPMIAHLRSVILMGALPVRRSGGGNAAAAEPWMMVAAAAPESEPTNPLRVHSAISLVLLNLSSQIAYAIPSSEAAKPSAIIAPLIHRACVKSTLSHNAKKLSRRNDLRSIWACSGSLFANTCFLM